MFFHKFFLNSASSAAAPEFYLPGVCTHIDTEGKQRKARVRNILKSSKKPTIFYEHPVYLNCMMCRLLCGDKQLGLPAKLVFGTVYGEDNSCPENTEDPMVREDNSIIGTVTST